MSQTSFPSEYVSLLFTNWMSFIKTHPFLEIYFFIHKIGMDPLDWEEVLKGKNVEGNLAFATVCSWSMPVPFFLEDGFASSFLAWIAMLLCASLGYTFIHKYSLSWHWSTYYVLGILQWEGQSPSGNFNSCEKTEFRRKGGNIVSNW